MANQQDASKIPALQKMKHMKFAFDWGEKTSFWAIEFFADTFARQDGYPWNNINNSISYLIGTEESGGYAELGDFNNRIKKHGNFFLDQKKITWLMVQYKKLQREIDTFAKKISKVGTRTLSRVELYDLFDEFQRLGHETARWYRATRPESEGAAAKKITDAIIRFYPPEQVSSVFQMLTTSPYSNPLQEEKAYWLSLLKKRCLGDKDIREYVRKFSMFCTNMHTFVQVERALRSRHHQDRRRYKRLAEEHRFAIGKQAKARVQQQKILKHLRPAKIGKYILLFHRFGEYRFRIKPGYAGIEILCAGLLEEIAKSAQCTPEELQEFFTLPEILAFLKEKQPLPLNEIKDRRLCRVVVIANREKYYLYGEEGLGFLKKTVLKKSPYQESYQGTTAYPGKVSGKVQIVVSNRMDDIQKAAQTFKKGDILVTHNTQPPMLPLMQKAGAIVNSIGGVTCHSAIVAREFHIPCVVGIDSIHLKLKTGDYIEVDATKGIVRKLPKTI